MSSLNKYIVILHDYGNLQSQIIYNGDIFTCNSISDNLNFLFANAGDSQKYESQVIEDNESTPDGDQQF